MLTVDVVGLEHQLAELAECGLIAEDSVVAPASVRKVTRTDPDGNRVVLFKALSQPR
ncbi:MAG TPA: hypothetical protein VFG86_14580 [Chloroflexota bacterium]|nr:hypothetical protein [Chloroflexota bacterium]